MMKKRLITVVIGLLSFYTVQAQWELENKYWTYRDRYRNYFTKIGPKSGESQSAASIKELEAKSLNYRIVNGKERATNAASLAAPPTTANVLCRTYGAWNLSNGIFY
jgi:hypothetical protein